MNQTNNNSDFTKIISGAFSTITGVVKDVKNDLNEKILGYLEKMDLVKREEFEVMQAMLTEIRLEQEKIKKTLMDLEKKLKK